MVDTKTSENALRLALEAREMGVDTITELELQAGTLQFPTTFSLRTHSSPLWPYFAEQIDRIESDVENIHTNLDKGDRLLRFVNFPPSLPSHRLPTDLLKIRGVESFGGYLKNKFSNPTQIHGTSRAVERKASKLALPHIKLNLANR